MCRFLSEMPMFSGSRKMISPWMFYTKQISNFLSTSSVQIISSTFNLLKRTSLIQILIIQSNFSYYSACKSAVAKKDKIKLHTYRLLCGLSFLTLYLICQFWGLAIQQQIKIWCHKYAQIGTQLSDSVENIAGMFSKAVCSWCVKTSIYGVKGYRLCNLCRYFVDFVEFTTTCLERMARILHGH